MKQLGNLAVVCAQRPDVLMQIYGSEVSVHVGEGPERAVLSTKWDDDETIDPREQYRYYEEYGVYAYPEKQPIWYLPVLLDLWDVSFNTKEAQIVFVRYADSEQNSFWGPGTEPIARWDIEEYANYNIDQYQSYTVTLKEMFGEWDIEEVLPSQS